METESVFIRKNYKQQYYYELRDLPSRIFHANVFKLRQEC